ncbi:MAG: cysteine synthase A [Chromatiaceae bacterium]|nr:cysteine synthase A [Chromatiaceae bacterium]
MSQPFDNILGTIGNTPIVKISRLAPPGVELYVKLEAFNPMGSVKDRLAIGVIEDAERSGRLQPGQTVVEATSGNTGIGLAMVCAQKGYPLVVTMAENFSVERRKMMRFLGAKVILTPADQMGTGMLAKAVELAEAHGWFLCRQFENEANADIHSRTTAPEILDSFRGKRLDFWVTGFGTGGTLKGVSRVLKAERPETQIVVCEPDNSQLLSSGIPQERAPDGSPSASHPSFRPHQMHGWSPDFIPKLTGDVVSAELIDQIVPVKGADALSCSRELAQKEGIFTGISGGATFAGALRVCAEAPEGSTVLCMLPDTGERYLSTPLFEDVFNEMSIEEIEISRSTPSFRFDVVPESAQEDEPAAPVTEAARRFVAETIGDAGQPVVMFALEWCEFCWSVRKLFAKCGIQYRSVDIDSAELKKDDWGGQIRSALIERTDFKTIPQIFVGGELIGGCTDLFDAFRQGQVQQLMRDKGIGFDEKVSLDPYELLPAWLHPRQ